MSQQQESNQNTWRALGRKKLGKIYEMWDLEDWMRVSLNPRKKMKMNGKQAVFEMTVAKIFLEQIKYMNL